MLVKTRTRLVPLSRHGYSHVCAGIDGYGPKQSTQPPETSCLNTTQLARARTSESQKTDFHEQQVVRRVLRRTATRMEWACGLDKPSIHYFRGGSHDCARRRPALVDGGGGIQAHIYCSGWSVQGRRRAMRITKICNESYKAIDTVWWKIYVNIDS